MSCTRIIRPKNLLGTVRLAKYCTDFFFSFFLYSHISLLLRNFFSRSSKKIATVLSKLYLHGRFVTSYPINAENNP